MGAEISADQNFRNFEKNYVFQKQFHDQNYGEIKLLKHITNDQYIAIKNVMQQGILDPKTLEKCASEQKNIRHPGIVDCFDIFFNNHEEMCSRFIKIHMVYDYIPRTLQQEIEHRGTHHEFFSENEVISLIYTIVSALIYLKKYKKHHGDINPDHILITKEGKFKITDVGYLCEFDEYKRFYEGLGKNCYLSPQLFQALGHREVSPMHNPDKSCLFSLGMTIIQIGLLEYPQEIYNFDTFQIEEKLLKAFQNKKALGLYSEGLQRLIWRLLSFNESERPNYEEALNELDNIRNNKIASTEFVEQIEYSEKPKKAGKPAEQLFSPSPAKTLERETIFDNDEDEIVLNIPTNLEKVYEKIFNK